MSMDNEDAAGLKGKLASAWQAMSFFKAVIVLVNIIVILFEIVIGG